MGAGVVSFRRAVPAHAAAVADIHATAWRSTYQGLIPHLHLERLIAKRGPAWWRRQIEAGTNITLLLFDGEPQGYASWGVTRGSWPWRAGEIFELYVNPVYQGVGLGSKLFAAVRQELKREGLARLVVWALKDNENACAFYGGLGGVVMAAAQEHYGSVALTRVAFVWGVNVKSY